MATAVGTWYLLGLLTAFWHRDFPHLRVADKVNMSERNPVSSELEITPASQEVPRWVRLASDEVVLYNLRTHPKVLFTRVLIGLMLMISAVFYLLELYAAMPPGVNIAAGVALFAAASYFCVWPFLQWRSNRYLITNRQILCLNGVLYHKTHSSQLSRVSDLNVERGILDRIFNCGTLVVLNAAGEFAGEGRSGNRVTLHDIPKVLEVEQGIKDLVYRNR